MSLLDKPATGRPWWKRMTMLGMFAMGVGYTAESSGLITTGTTAKITEAVTESTQAGMNLWDLLYNAYMSGAAIVTGTGVYRHFAN